LTEDDVKKLYTLVEIPQYGVEILRYNNNKWTWRGRACSRIMSLMAFKDFVKRLNIFSNKMLIMNGVKDPELQYIKSNEVVYCNYEDDKEKYDLHSLDLGVYDYDFFMCNNTLEHLYNPIKCLKNIGKHLKFGGWFYGCVPVNDIPHTTPFHYATGFTSTGVAAMLIEAGFEIISIGQWGNVDYLKKMFLTGWPDYKHVSFYNDKKCPVICWVFAKKVG
jgi:SAM-dependent methyltransferase